MKTDLFSRVYNDLVKRRERLLSGKINAIKWGLPRFELESPGIEQGTYYLITAGSKAAKTQFTDWAFVINSLQQVIDNKLDIKLKIFYFSLEIRSEEKMRHLFSNILYVKEGIRVSSKDLRSTRSALSQEVLDILAKYENYFKKVEEIVTFIDDHRTPTSIFMFMKNYAEQNGTHHYKEVTIKGDKKIKIFDYYEPDDPDEYVLCITDHVSLLAREHEGGKLLSLRECIGKFSATYMVKLRNIYNYSPIIVQQQALVNESFDRVKAQKIKPTASDLADNKATIRDANIAFGLTSPYRQEIPEYMGYDITVFKDNIRFLEIIVSRDGGAGVTCPLFFDGATNYFKELPLVKDSIGMKQVYKFLNTIRETQ